MAKIRLWNFPVSALYVATGEEQIIQVNNIIDSW